MKTYKEFIEESFGKKLGMGAAALGVALGMRHLGNMGVKPSVEPAPTTQSVKHVNVPVAPAPVPQLAKPTKPKQTPEQLSSAFHEKLKAKHSKEYDTIMDAAKANGIAPTDHENLSILFSIRSAEHGGPGKEFGVLLPTAKTLRKQAGEAAFAIMKARKRWDPKKHGAFIPFLGSSYSPVGAKNDPTNLNKNWVGNVTKFNDENMAALKPESDN